MSDPSPNHGRTALLINARSRKGGATQPIVVEALGRHGLTLDRVVRVRKPAHLPSAIDALVDWGVERLIVGGGDGTLSTVAPRLARRDILLGVIPMGTANDFARTLGIPFRPAAAAELAASNSIRAIDLAQANDQFFLNVASIGMSVSAADALTWRVKQQFGTLAYLYAGARVFARHLTFLARLEVGTEVIEARAHQIVVGNGRYYGGGVLVSRQSTLDDGLLAAYALGTRGRWHLLRTMAMLRFRVPIDRPGDFYVATPSLRVETTPGMKVNLDGEIRTTTPVEFKVVPGALRVLAPTPPAGAGRS
ncbi:lipid kinase [Tundrisphaera sp. TA3]|uniref:lipid kinase n=1 Tax=Tundrisphaera sp. TA3 TaxID=3435775 RepID=UPI003EB6CD3B